VLAFGKVLGGVCMLKWVACILASAIIMACGVPLAVVGIVGGIFGIVLSPPLEAEPNNVIAMTNSNAVVPPRIEVFTREVVVRDGLT
jgi:hypothetical protein